MDSNEATRNVRLVMEYDGTDFHGFQIQPCLRTVQGTIESVLQELLSEEIRLTGAGRTDEGVHACGQVANFRTSSDMRTHILKRALNSRLPADIVVKSADEVSPDFHSRFSAKSRVYRYDICLIRSPIRRRYAWHIKYNLNIGEMERASDVFIGSHDFTSFCVAKSTVDESSCVVYSSVWRRKADVLQYEIEANRFLHNMVRVMVGTMVDVGRGRHSMEDIAHILEAKDRRRAGPTAPPHGLFLVAVKY